MVPIPFVLQLFISVSDLTALSFISALILFSFFSLSFILYFRLKTLQSHHLKDFNSLWSVRILLVSFICLWALSDLLRLPFIRRYLFPSLPSLTQTQQANLCKIHVVLSQGLFEPGFLVTLLFLVNFSTKKKNPDDTFGTAIAIVFVSCLPIFLLQVFFVFFFSNSNLPEIFSRSFVIVKGDSDGGGVDTVLCTYPLFSTIIFGASATVYVLFFLLACWKVVSLVINKGLRVRIYVLASVVLLSLPAQIVFLAVSAFWTPYDAAFDGLALAVFLTVLSCAVVGEGILVIRPITDALAAGGECWQWRKEDRLPIVLGRKLHDRYRQGQNGDIEGNY